MSAPSSTIYHIAERASWEASGESYLPEAFAADRFIHCSQWSQLSGVSRAIFPGRTDVVVLEIDLEWPASDQPAFVRRNLLVGGRRSLN
ncbi:MAG: DUF952 domain-containing protein [Spirochaetota bacterium]